MHGESLPGHLPMMRRIASNYSTHDTSADGGVSSSDKLTSDERMCQSSVGLLDTMAPRWRPSASVTGSPSRRRSPPGAG